MNEILKKARIFLELNGATYIKPPKTLLELKTAAQVFEAGNSLSTGRCSRPLWDLYHKACEVKQA